MHPETFAVRFVKSEIARDALLDGRLDDAATILTQDAGLTFDECAVLYAHSHLKSGEYRRRMTATRGAAIASCVARGLLKQSKNGATAITTEGKALETVWYRQGQEASFR